MKKVLILTDFYPPFNNANGICTKRYADAFLIKGYEVHVLCFLNRGERKSEICEGIHVHRFKPRIFFRMREYGQYHANWIGQIIYKVAIMLHRIAGIVHIWEYPIESNLASNRFYRTARQIAIDNNIKNVIPSFMPAESLIAACRLKRDGLNISSIFWDTCSYTANANRIPYIKKVGIRLEKKVFNVSDIVCHLHSNYSHYLEADFKEFQDKFVEIDIPFPKKTDETEGELLFNNLKINLMYMGGLSRSNQYFDKWINILSGLGSDYNVNFFSRGDAEGILQEMSDNLESSIIRRGQVDIKVLQRAQANADGFVTLGASSDTNMNIPSKIFECMASGRIWIHFYKYKHDVCLEYVNKYPLGLAINMESKSEDIDNRIRLFVKENMNKYVTRSELEEAFPMSSTSKVVEILDQKFE